MSTTAAISGAHRARQVPVICYFRRDRDVADNLIMVHDAGAPAAAKTAAMAIASYRRKMTGLEHRPSA